MKCPKCCHERTTQDDEYTAKTECPSCGVVYAKYKPKVAIEKNLSQENNDHIEEEKVGFSYKNAGIATVFIFCFIVYAVYQGNKSSYSNPKQSSYLESNGKSLSNQDINYTVIEKSTLGSIKCSIDIRLEKKISKEALKQLALDLRDAESKQYDRMFILYYLPNMPPGAGAWATSHFNPNLEIKILGTTIEEEKALLVNSSNYSGEIIGKWLDEAPYVGATYTLYKKDSKILMSCKFKDGSSSEKEMIQKSQSGRLRFEERRGNSFGEYYLVDSTGNLDVYDTQGLIRTFRSIK